MKTINTYLFAIAIVSSINVVSDETLDTISKYDFPSPLPNCFDSAITSYSEWSMLFDDKGIVLDKDKLHNCKVIVLYEGNFGDVQFSILEYQNGKKNGYGVMVREDGSLRAAGQWKDSAPHGEFTSAGYGGLWNNGWSLAERCESFGFELKSSYQRQCQNIMWDYFNKIIAEGKRKRFDVPEILL